MIAIDVERVVAPIPGTSASACGVDLRRQNGGVRFYELKDLYKQAKRLEREEVWSDGDRGGPGRPDWRGLNEAILRALAEESKDLQLVAWLIEGLARTDGVAGVRAGFAIARGLVEAYFDDLHPAPDEDGVETRIRGLLELAEPTDARPVGLSLDDVVIGVAPPGPVSLAQVRLARKMEGYSQEQRRRMRGQRAHDLGEIRQSVVATDVRHFRCLLEELDGCRAEVEALAAALEPKCRGVQLGTFGNLTDVFDDVARTVRGLVGERLDEPTPPARPAPSTLGPAGVPPATDASLAAGPSTSGGGPIRSREQAFERMREVAEFFRRAEPHNPVSYVMPEVIRWGQTPLPQLITEFSAQPNGMDWFSRLISPERARPSSPPLQPPLPRQSGSAAATTTAETKPDEESGQKTTAAAIAKFREDAKKKS